jgi:putative ABC transport system permease protein
METHGLLTFGFGLPREDYPSAEERISFVQRFQEGLEAIPGVTKVGFASNLPLSGNMWFEDPEVLGQTTPEEGESNPIAIAFMVSPGFLEAMGIETVRGQGFRSTDQVGSYPTALVNEEAVRVFWDGEDPVGTQVRLRYPGAEDRPWITVTGIVEDTRPQGLRSDPFPQFFFQNSQSLLTTGSARGSGYFVVETPVDPLSLIPGIRRVAGELDPDLPLTDLRTMDDLVNSATARSRFSTSLLSAFALSALILAMVGVYGVVSYSVARRIREAGIRIALGAQANQVVNLMVKEGMRPALFGVGLGLIGAFFAAGLLEDQLFQVSPTDPGTFLGLAPALALVAWLASWIPARRSSRISPVEALREE